MHVMQGATAVRTEVSGLPLAPSIVKSQRNSGGIGNEIEIDFRHLLALVTHIA